MTYNEICTALSEAGIENHRTEAAMLVCHFYDITKAQLLGMHDHDFDSEELSASVAKRCSHYPLQYILGYWDFFRETYRVTEDTLIPRQDTEKLVELAINIMPEGARFIDLCTGSGCVAISTLASRPDCRGVAVDCFEKTLAVATENAERNGVLDRLGMLRADVLEPSFMDSLGYFECILSNPPYIVSNEIEGLADELSFEPDAALDGGADGLKFYRKIIGSYGRYLTENGVMLLEIGHDQAAAVSDIANENGFSCEVFRDYGGNDRVVYLKKKEIV